MEDKSDAWRYLKGNLVKDEKNHEIKKNWERKEE